MSKRDKKKKKKFNKKKRARLLKYREERVEEALEELINEQNIFKAQLEDADEEKRERLRRSFYKSALIVDPKNKYNIYKIKITDVSASGIGFWASGDAKIKKGTYNLVYAVNGEKINVPISILWRNKHEMVYSYGAKVV